MSHVRSRSEKLLDKSKARFVPISKTHKIGAGYPASLIKDMRPDGTPTGARRVPTGIAFKACVCETKPVLERRTISFKISQPPTAVNQTLVKAQTWADRILHQTLEHCEANAVH